MQLIGRGIARGLIRDVLWYNGRLTELVKINDCDIGYELEIKPEVIKHTEKQLKNKLQAMFEQYTNVRIKNTDVEVNKDV
jgi:hypothetical protein